MVGRRDVVTALLRVNYILQSRDAARALYNNQTNHLQLSVIGAQSVPIPALLGQQSLLLHPLIELETIAMIPRALVHQVVARTGNVAGPVGSVAVVQRAQFHHVVHEVHEGLALLVLCAKVKRKLSPRRISHLYFVRRFDIDPMFDNSDTRAFAPEKNDIGLIRNRMGIQMKSKTDWNIF